MRPWRLAALALTAIAAVELMLLVVVGGALLAKPESPTHAIAAKRTTATRDATTAKPQKAVTTSKTTSATAELPRRKVGVLVLNGNGRQGAASAAATRVSGRGYRIRGVANAPEHDYVRSIVMYRPGFEGEGRRLARDLGVQVVGPLDGMRPRDLHGAHTVLILGA